MKFSMSKSGILHRPILNLTLPHFYIELFSGMQFALLWLARRTKNGNYFKIHKEERVKGNGDNRT